MNGKTNRFALVGESAFDRLLNPPCGIGAELATFDGVKAIDSFHETNVALRDQVGDGHAVASVVLSDLHNEAKIGLDHLGARSLVALFDPFRKCNFILGSEERSFRDLLHVGLHAAVEF